MNGKEEEEQDEKKSVNFNDQKEVIKDIEVRCLKLHNFMIISMETKWNV